MGIDIKTLPYNKAIGDIMFESKKNELQKVADEYSISLDDMKGILHKELTKSNTKVGACNTAVDFLIVDTINENKKYKSIETAIKENILASAIYYVNAIGKSEYV